MIMMTKQWLNVCNFREELVVSQQERFQSFSTGLFSGFVERKHAKTYEYDLLFKQMVLILISLALSMSFIRHTSGECCSYLKNLKLLSLISFSYIL